MKSQIRRAFLFTALISICVIFNNLIFPNQIAAQTKKPVVKPKTVYWYLDYTVTIKGNGRKERGIDGSPEIVWSIDRTYSGNVALNERKVDLGTDPATLMNMQKVAEAYKSERNLIFTAKKSRDPEANNLGRVQINDKLEIIKKEPCSDDTEESTVDTKIWKFDAVTSGFDVNLMMDNESASYNVRIPLVYTDRAALYSHTGYRRTNGVTPSKNATPVVETKALIPYPPDVQGLIGGNFAVFHDPVRNFEKTVDSWEYDSQNLQPDAPLIPGVPDSKTNVKVRVIYRISKKPLY